MVKMRKVCGPVPVCDWFFHPVNTFDSTHFVSAHSGAVQGVATDALNQLTITAGSDWLLKFWRFKSRKQEETLKLNTAPASMMLHRER